MAHVRLSRILRDDPPRPALTSFGRESTFDRADLVERASALAAAIDKVGRGRWLVFSENSHAAAVSLLASLHTGSTLVFAPNSQPETLRRLSTDVRGAILDPGKSIDGVPSLAPLEQPPASTLEETTLDRSAPFIEFHTSGTTGERGRSVKALRHLEDEIATLEASFASVLPEGARIFATVSHQHIYGLLFRVLWPLTTERPFFSDTLLHARELFPRMAESDACALVSTPAHLRRMVAGAGLRSLRGTCRAIFSSGSPLDPETARSVIDQVGFAPHEILGSTETGGVAVRQQHTQTRTWVPLQHVSVELGEEDRLVVESPYVSDGKIVAGERRRFTMGDRATLHDDGTFTLLERADRTVKVAGKRLSLPDMERELEAHDWIDEAATVVFDQAAESRVHAVIVPSQIGRENLQTLGRRDFGAALGRHLAGHFDRVHLPRLWRIVESLPRDTQGKLSAEALRAAFDSIGRDPILLVESSDAHSIERRLEVPTDLAYLDGHFDGAPIVAGVVMLRWVMSAAEALREAAPRIETIEALKFPTPLRPGQRFTLRVETDADTTRLDFHLRDAERVFATGRCRLTIPGSESH